MASEPADFSKAEPPQLLRGLAALQAEAAAGRRLPPVEKWNPPHCGAIPMRIARDGTWHYMGTPIGRPRMVRLFSTILRRDPGEFVLVTPVERVAIEVEDAPFVAVTLDVTDPGGAGQALNFTTNVGDEVAADAAHPIHVIENAVTGEPSPYVLVRGGLEARISRAVFYELADLAVERDGQLGVVSGGAFFPLGRAA